MIKEMFYQRQVISWLQSLESKVMIPVHGHKDMHDSNLIISSYLIPKDQADKEMETDEGRYGSFVPGFTQYGFGENSETVYLRFGNEEGVAPRFDVGISWVYKIRKRFCDTGSYKALPRSGRPRKLNEEDVNKISEMIKIDPSLTLDEIKEKGKFTTSCTTIHRVLQRLGHTYKKHFLRRNKTELM